MSIGFKTGKLILACGIALSFFCSAFGADKPTWNMNDESLSKVNVKGSIKLNDGILKLDGINSFSIPSKVLGNQEDYTIEFEFGLSPNFKNLPRATGAICIVSNTDKINHTGFSLIYMPPEWDRNGGISNRMGIEVNGYWNGEFKGLSKRKFDKISIVVKDKLASIYRNGLIISLTGEIKPSRQPLTIGEWGWRGNTRFGKTGDKPLPEPYEIRNFKIYDRAITPSGYDNSTRRMRNYSGKGYSMQRADIKDKTLPRILIIGDSQSMGYRSFITDHFKGKAYVDYWVGGSWLNPNDVKRKNSKTKESYRGVLSNGPYDVVTWNSMTGHMWNIKHPERCPRESIVPNFTEMVRFLKAEAPNTQFIWIRCTPRRALLPNGKHTVDNPANAVAVENNKLVDGVMKKHDIPEVDLYTVSLKYVDKVKPGWKDLVHWDRTVYKVFANEIIAEIEKHLPAKHMSGKK